MARTFRLYHLLALALAATAFLPAHAVDEDELLPVEQAFRSSASLRGDVLRLEYQVADGYFLYRHRFAFTTDTPGVTLGEPLMPAGKVKDDPLFGRVETYRHAVMVEVPVTFAGARPAAVALNARSQGCADLGVCYPPRTEALSVTVPPASAILATLDGLGATSSDPFGQSSLPQSSSSPAAEPSALDVLTGLGEQLGGSGPEFLHPDEAFILEAEARDAGTVALRWQAAPGYYLYRHQMAFVDGAESDVTLAEARIPAGKVKEDEYFGRVEVYYGDVEVLLPVARETGAARAVVDVTYQGCADAGLCYPPIKRTVELTLPPADATLAGGVAPGAGGLAPAAAMATPAALTVAAPAPRLSEESRIARSLIQDRLPVALLTFFGFGLLLAFTPCVLPMVPILSSIIAGQGERLSTGRGFSLSLVYVLAMALTYTVAGVVAALFGQNLQVAFQDPVVLGSFAALFVLLSLSMFGLYDLQIPAAWQARLTGLSNRQQGGTYAGVGVMGMLSALIVGPCVAAPLAAALIVIGSSGDPVRGGLALFSLSLGMGTPLLLIGASAGKLLPRVGPWMESIKRLFGVMLLAVAAYLLDRIVPPDVALLVWAVPVVVAAVMLGALDRLADGASSGRRLTKAGALVVMLYGVTLVGGAAVGGGDLLNPLRGLSGAPAHEGLEFRRIKGPAALEAALREAGAAGRPVMLDYYADWCISCKEMERFTFTDASVQAALEGAVLLQTDVTANDAEDQALLKRFNLFGPPAILFFGVDGRERRELRVVGYLDAEDFLAVVDQLDPISVAGRL